MQTVVVRAGHAKPLWAGHPWVHARAVAAVRGSPDANAPDVVHVEDADGRAIGRGFLAPESALRVRLLDTPPFERPVDDVLAARVAGAAALRRQLFPHPTRTNAYRLVHAEGDGLPGLVVDRYAEVLVAQFATAAMHGRRELLARALLASSGARSLVARPGGFEREEGIPAEGVAFELGAPVPPLVPVRENGMLLEVDPRHGQKTGHYVDQRENRSLVAELAGGRTVLDVFGGTGGFAIQALRQGARGARLLDASERATERARFHALLNGVADRLDVVVVEAKSAFPALKAAQETFDVVVLDPPNLFPRRGGVGRAPHAMRDLNVQALTRVRAGGVLATFCCSARLDARGLRELVASAARECRRRLAVLRELAAGPDHPVLAAAPEGRYLSGLLLRVDELAA